MKKALFLAVILSMTFAACATIYQNPELQAIRQRHRQVAVLPFDVTISTSRLPKDVTVEMVKKLEEDEGFTTQSLFYSRFLKNSADFSVTFQDVDRTNAILAKNRIGYQELRTALKEDLAKTLGVDAVISGKIQRERPMSEGAAIALGILIGFWGSTNKVNIDLTIHDGTTGELFWKYTHQISGSVGSSSEQLVKAFTRKIARDFPYNVSR